MYSSKILRTVLIPAATVVVAEDQLKKLANNPPVCRPSELPIYTPEVIALPVEAEPTIPSYIEDTVKTVRTNVTKVYTEVMAYKEVGRGYLEQSKENADWLFQYLREEDNTTPKAGAIAIGGVTGLIFGLRGGLIKRAIYASTGALGMAAVCYPKEASEYSQTAISEAKKYATIAYNFAYGGAEKEAEQVIVNSNYEENVNITEQDALNVVSKTHESSSKSCHCPVGACLGHHEENIIGPQLGPAA